jgi:hypothetical protein
MFFNPFSKKKMPSSLPRETLCGVGGVGRRMASYLLNGCRFSFLQMRRVVVMVAHNVNVFNTIKLYA